MIDVEKFIEICNLCHGSGLEPCDRNLTIKAKDSDSYIVCSKCKGTGAAK